MMATLVVNARAQLSRLIHSHCMSAALLAERIGVGADVQQALPFAFDRYDGGGLPKGARGEAIPIPCGSLSSPTWSRSTTGPT